MVELVKNKIVQQLKFHSISDKPMQQTINDICSIIDDYNAHLTTEVTRLREALEGQKLEFYKKLLAKLDLITSGKLNLVDYKSEVVDKVQALTPEK